MNNIFAIMTDFGDDYAVASMKGVLYSSKIPNINVVDLDHSIEKFSILSAAFAINKIYPFYPQGTHFICVVDPGVGSKRDAICIEYDGYTFIGPDNGIFHYIIKNLVANKNGKVYNIDQNVYNNGFNTFHGRDMFVPAAIHHAQNQIEHFKENTMLESLKTLDVLDNENIVTYIDSFGNIKTNLSLNTMKVGSIYNLQIGSKVFSLPFSTTFAEVDEGQLFCYKGSNNTLEIAVNLGSAKEYTNAKIGNTVLVL